MKVNVRSHAIFNVGDNGECSFKFSDFFGFFFFFFFSKDFGLCDKSLIN
jgi:hypothetical protein